MRGGDPFYVHHIWDLSIPTKDGHLRAKFGQRNNWTDRGKKLTDGPCGLSTRKSFTFLGLAAAGGGAGGRRRRTRTTNQEDSVSRIMQCQEDSVSIGGSNGETPPPPPYTNFQTKFRPTFKTGSNFFWFSQLVPNHVQARTFDHLLSSTMINIWEASLHPYPLWVHFQWPHIDVSVKVLG